MNIVIKATNMELTEAIKDYANKRAMSFEKLFANDSGILVEIELGKDTNHHKQGEMYRAEINISGGGQAYRAMYSGVDIYSAIDEVRDEIERKVTNSRDRSRSLFRRGARSVKKMLKGISKRNPFTSKY